MIDIAKELIETIKWIPELERNSKTYREYLDKVCVDLKMATIVKVKTSIM